MDQENQSNFYDGLLYHLFVDPALRRIRRLLRTQVSPKSSLIDIGCGTGELVFALADMCSELVGVEVSHRMWSYANRRARDKELSNVQFIWRNGAGPLNFPSGHFEYAAACMVMHEMDANQRLQAVLEMRRLARMLILVDYRVVPPKNLTGILFRVAERLAGRRHYQNFLSFLKQGGLLPLLDAVEGAVQQEIILYDRCLHLLRVT
jgi:SAM-dependent methyltransferase